MGEQVARTEQRTAGRGRKKVAAFVAITALTATGCADQGIDGLPNYPAPTLEGVASTAPQHVCFGYAVKARKGPSVIVNPTYELYSGRPNAPGELRPKSHLTATSTFDRGQSNDWTWYRFDKGDKKFHESGSKRCMQTANVDSAKQEIQTVQVNDHGHQIAVNVVAGSNIHRGQDLNDIVNNPVAAALVGDQLTDGLVHQFYAGQNLDVDAIAPEGKPDSYR